MKQFSEEARRRRGPRKKKHYILKFAIAAAALYGAYRLAMSPLFGIKDIVVTDNAHFTAVQIAELSGVRKGDNIFVTHTGELKARLEDDPYIRSASVERHLPNRISIAVDERSEDMLVNVGDGQYAAINYDGTILRIDALGSFPILAVVDGLSPIDPVPGRPLKVKEADRLKPAIDFFRIVDESGFFFKRLDVGGVMAKAYVFDRLICEGEMKAIEKSLPEIKKVVSDLTGKGIERGVISIGGGGTCSFTPELGQQLPDTADPPVEPGEDGEGGEPGEGAEGGGNPDVGE